MNLELIMATMEHFHHCTHLPIRFFTNLGQTPEIYHFGCSRVDLDILKKHCSKEIIRELINNLPREQILHHPINTDIYLTLCLVDAEDIKQGAFVIGPYTTSLHSKSHLVFKPLHCMSHLLNLLYSIKTHQYTTLTLTNHEDFYHHPLGHHKFDDYSYHVIKAKAYIEQNYHKSLPLQEVADYLGINKSYFSTIFKQITKQSFCNYTNHFRIEKSKNLLIHSNDSILDIALATGFSSSSYFNNIFKKLVGLTPIEYRQFNKQNKK